MVRIPLIEPAAAQGRAKELFEGPMKGKHLNIFRGMAAAPAAFDAYYGLAHALARGSLGPREREVIALVLAERNDCDYCRAAHTVIAKGAGLTEAQTVAARRGAPTGDPRLDALARFALAVQEKGGDVSDDDVRAFLDAGFQAPDMAEVVANIALNLYTNMFNHLNRTPVDFPAPPAV